MFGSYRTVLALFVVASHLMSITVIGQYAVHGFFILSGFLMTLIMHRTYGYSPGGFAAFATNRFLRLFPAYWILCIPMVGILLWAGPQAVLEFNASMGIPTTTESWIQNASMLYFDLIPMRETPRISPPTWALTVELLFYLLIGLGLSRSRGVSLGWLVMSLAYMVATHLIDLPRSYRYSAVMAGSLPFAIGACLFHFKEILDRKLKWIRGKAGLWLILVFFGGNCLAGCLVLFFEFPPAFGYPFYYLNLLANGLLILALSDTSRPFPLSRKSDLFVGDFSYPIYLLHYPVGLACSVLIFGEARRGFHLDGFIVFIATIPLCAVLSLLVVRLVDRPIQKLRSTLKRRRLQGSGAPTTAPR